MLEGTKTTCVNADDASGQKRCQAPPRVERPESEGLEELTPGTELKLTYSGESAECHILRQLILCSLPTSAENTHGSAYASA
jgi:hypothetical protein